MPMTCAKMNADIALESSALAYHLLQMSSKNILMVQRPRTRAAHAHLTPPPRPPSSPHITPSGPDQPWFA